MLNFRIKYGENFTFMIKHDLSGSGESLRPLRA
jgi:hypothetical protein